MQIIHCVNFEDAWIEDSCPSFSWLNVDAHIRPTNRVQRGGYSLDGLSTQTQQWFLL